MQYYFSSQVNFSKLYCTQYDRFLGIIMSLSVCLSVMPCIVAYRVGVEGCVKNYENIFNSINTCA